MTRIVIGAAESVSSVTVSTAGSGYSTAPTVTISGGGGGTGALATATLGSSVLAGFTLTANGSGYSSAPAVTLSGGGATTAGTATAALGTVITGISVNGGGTGYNTAPTISFSGGGGSGATAVATVSAGVVTSVTVTNGGSGYTSAPTIAFNVVSGGSGASATATFSVTSLTLSTSGAGYTSAPTVTISGGGGTGAAATAIFGSPVSSITVSNGGSGYTSTPTVTLTGGGGSGATATAVRGTTGQSFANPNEAYGASGTTIYITALGTGTFPAAGWGYNFFVNGVSIGTTTGIPGGTSTTAPWTPPQPGSYSITAQATGIGDPVISLPVRYFATGTAITSPVNGSIVPTGSSVVVEATATPQPLGNGQNAFVQRIDFFADGSTTAFASDTTAPYSSIYTPSTAGSHTIEAKAYDNLGNQISANGTATRSLTVVTPVGTAPTSTISTPQNNSTVAVPISAVTVSVDANSPSGRVTRVELYIDGALFGSDTSFPYSFSWLPTVVGTYRLVALTYDDVGNVVASSTNSVRVAAPPTVAITKPSSNGTVTGGSPTQLSATASTATAGATISSVQFFVDSTFVGETKVAESGNTYTITATLAQKKDADGNVVASSATALAVDSAGLSTTSVGVSFNVTAGGGGAPVVIGAAPTISITAPTNGAVLFVNSAVTLAVTAADSDGHPTSVDFIVDGKTVGTDLTYPYTGSWTPTSLGTYTITARVTDDKGNAVTSAEVNVLVSDPASNSNSDVAAVYTGTYSGLSGGIESGQFALVTVGSKTAAFMAYSTTPPYKTYSYAGGTVSGTSVSFSSSSAQGSLSASAISSGVSGTFDGTRLLLIGQIGVSGSTTVAAGYYQGSLSGRIGSRLVGIVSANGVIFVSGTDTNFSDVGSGTVSDSGSFRFTTNAGNTFSGTVNPTSGLMTGSISGATSASFTGALATGGTYSDGVLKGLSTRGFVGTGANVMIAGFIVNGTVAKQIVVRGMGPSLASAGVSGVLADPTLAIFNSANVSIASNNDWNDTPANRALMAGVGLAAPGSARESFAVATLAPGAYTVQLSGVSSGTGVGLVEIYDTDTVSPFTSRKVAAISTRGFVNSGDGSLIAGFIVNGTSPKKLLIEAVGPSLSGVSGLLADPVLQIIRNGTVIRENDNWEVGNDSKLVIDAASRSGATPLAAGGKDAAILINLQPGVYTAVASGAAGSTGIALINVYEVPYLPRVFTEHGALMAGTVLNSPRAVQMSLYLVKAFIRMREALTANAVVLQRLSEIDRKLLEHDVVLRDVYEKLRPLLDPPPPPPKPKIGFNRSEP